MLNFVCLRTKSEGIDQYGIDKISSNKVLLTYRFSCWVYEKPVLNDFDAKTPAFYTKS